MNIRLLLQFCGEAVLVAHEFLPQQDESMRRAACSALSAPCNVISEAEGTA